MNTKKLKLLVLALILLGGLAYGYYTLIFSNQIAEVVQHKNEIEKGRLTLSKLEEIQKDRKGTLEKIAGMEQELINLDKAIPSFNYATEFNLQIYSILKERGLKNSIQPHNPSSGNGYGYEEVSISVSGKKSEVLNFIRYLKQQTRKVRIKGAVIKVTNAQEIEVNLKIQIFYMNN